MKLYEPFRAQRALAESRWRRVNAAATTVKALGMALILLSILGLAYFALVPEALL